jgi:hypothetical protein
VNKIAISGLVALAAVLGGAAVPAVAMARSTSAIHPLSAAAVRTAEAARIAEAERIAGIAGITWPADVARSAAASEVSDGEPLVSCVLATDCLGVESTSLVEISVSGTGGVSGTSASGSMIDAAKTVAPIRAVRWNGTSWKGVGVAVPKGLKSADVGGVSCKGAKSCLVVGDYYTSTSDNAMPHALALIDNGTSLKPTPAVPLPKGTTDAMLTAVSCATTRYCVAIGEAGGASSAFGESGQLTLIETWNGAKWTLRTVAQPSESSDTTISGVSCATPAFCVLAGEKAILTSKGNSATISFKLSFASWNGKKLTTMKPAAVGGSGDLVAPTGVSCATSANCAVTGLDLATTSNSTVSPDSFTEVWNGKAWQLAKTPWSNAAAPAVTLSVSCYAAHSCEAVGAAIVDPTSADDESADALAASYSGTAATLQPVPAPSKGSSTLFTSVSCLPWGTCVAVGETGKNTAPTASVMTGIWNGKYWKLKPGF